MKYQAIYQIITIADEIRGMSMTRYQSVEEYKFNGLERRRSSEKTITIKDLAFVQMNTSALEGLSNRAMLFVVNQIMTGIKKYNLLWHRAPSRRTQERTVIQELVEAKLLFRTETPGMFLINPLKIWRGTIPSAVEATKNLLREHRKPTPELVHDLRPKDLYMDDSDEVNNRAYKQLTDSGDNLLREDEVEYGGK